MATKMGGKMRKLWYQLKRNLNLEKSYTRLVGILSIFVLFSGLSFALFSFYQESRGSLNITTGLLTYEIKSEEFIDKKIKVEKSTIKELTIEVESLNEIETLYQLYYTVDKDVEGQVEVTFGIQGGLAKKSLEEEKKSTRLVMNVNMN